jgi:hypothetical protein
MELLEIAAQLAQILTVVSILIAIRSNTELSRKQWNVDVFTTYSQRHENLIHEFPDHTFFDRFDD